MNQGSITRKLFAIAFIGGLCFVASLVVFGPVNERQMRNGDAKDEIAQSWGKRQVMIGPMLVGKKSVPGWTLTTDGKNVPNDIDIYVLPETLHYETVLIPEVRTRGIFRSVVYHGVVKVSGEFLGSDIRQTIAAGRNAVFSVVITDTRGIEQQIDLKWNGREYAFSPGPGVSFIEPRLQNSSGLHALVPVDLPPTKVPFSFTVELKGSEGISIAPLGKETALDVASSWPTPKFVGAFLPSQRNITDGGFTSEWRISSFGRPYPQTWPSGSVDLAQLVDSAAGVNLHEQIDAYDNVFRSIKYAILFIVITFAAFFLFDVLTKVRVHPIHYVLIGSALALFYLLLLSLSEHIGFPAAYLVSTTMIVLLVTSYSAFVLKQARRALPIFLILSLLYAYLYFVLQLEDYALLCGALLLFAILAALMFTTRRIDWYALDKSQ
jgi:inner membrane protein